MLLLPLWLLLLLLLFDHDHKDLASCLTTLLACLLLIKPGLHLARMQGLL
jgi:hypothetical protein